MVYLYLKVENKVSTNPQLLGSTYPKQVLVAKILMYLSYFFYSSSCNEVRELKRLFLNTSLPLEKKHDGTKSGMWKVNSENRNVKKLLKLT